jgi:hypothetical protein
MQTPCQAGRGHGASLRSDCGWDVPLVDPDEAAWNKRVSREAVATIWVPYTLSRADLPDWVERAGIQSPRDRRAAGRARAERAARVHARSAATPDGGML